ncbi:MAG: hypothetical protein ACRDN6_05330 [Gaiellaceae bacterium]
MSVGGALRAALADTYHQSWRLVLLNAALSAAVVPLLVAALWVPVALVVAILVAGPLALALMHCAVTLAQTEELSLRCWPAGVRLLWRRGLVLGLLVGVVVVAGIVAVEAYARADAWPLAALVLYVLAAFVALQLVLWPLAVSEPRAPLRSVLRSAATVFFQRPLELAALAAALAAVNLVGAAAALMPFLTLTVAYSFLAAAHFTLPRPPIREAESSWPV